MRIGHTVEFLYNCYFLEFDYYSIIWNLIKDSMH